jgi:parallel beta-helix repeat protein
MMLAENLVWTRMRSAAAIVSAGLWLALGVIMAPAASAAPTPVSSCQTLASPGSYALSTDLAAVDATCLEITASDVQLNLAGHTMACTGSGFAGSCQVAAIGPAGVSVLPGLTDVKVKGPGLIAGFDNGVAVVSSDAQVKALTLTGPVCDPGGCSRPNSEGIIAIGRVVDGVPRSGPVDVSLLGNSISGFARAIGLLGAECPGGGSECVLNGNRVEGSTGAQTCSGINLFATVGYTATQNVAHSNGSTPCFPRGGIIVGAGASANTLTNNDSSNNNGFGISIGPGTNGNTIVNNTALGNALFDLNAFPGTTNHWNQNNRCHTEGGAVPSTVCNPGE